MAQAGTSGDGRLELASADAILYLVAKGGETAVNKGGGDNPATVLLVVLGNTPPPKVVINEMPAASYSRQQCPRREMRRPIR